MEKLTYCDLWNGTFTPMFHSANVILGAGFVIPQNFEFALLLLRFLVSGGLVLTLIWAVDVVCKLPAFFLWNGCFTLINSLYVLDLLKRHFPIFIPSDLLDLYENVYKPLNITKKEFQILIKDSKTETFHFGRQFCQEHRTLVDKKLYVLISGMMTVRCDGLFIQAIQPLEFINSVEWKCNQYGQCFSTHQVCFH